MAPGRRNSPNNSYSLRQSRTCNRSAANERERKRMQSLSKAFTTLRAAIPWIPSDTKLSKLDTLTAAIEYISWLDQMLHLPSVPIQQQDPIQSIAQQKKTWLSSVKTNTKWRRLECAIVDRGVKKHHGQPPLPPHTHPHSLAHQSSEHQVKASIHESNCTSSYTSHITCCMNLLCKSVDEEVDGVSDELSSRQQPPDVWAEDNW